MAAILRRFTVTHEGSREDGWSRHRNDGLEYRVEIEVDADAEFVSKLDAWFKEQARGTTRPIGDPMLEDRSRRIDPTPPRALPPGPIDGEFIDDEPRRKR